jgi:hypothetical protein
VGVFRGMQVWRYSLLEKRSQVGRSVDGQIEAFDSRMLPGQADWEPTRTGSD